MRKFLLLLGMFVFIFSKASITQTSDLFGNVTDKETGQALYGVNIILKPSDTKKGHDIKLGTSTDFSGNFSIKLAEGNYEVTFNYIGFEEIKKFVTIKAASNFELNVSLRERAELISEVVVSASRYEQNLSEVTVSMNVIKPSMIENTNSFNMDQAMNQIPGVDVSDKQPSIRSSSGWSYGAGSRVIILMDDLPIMSGDAGDVKWNYIPIENISQVEVVKGASSVLYGSSAIGGVINVRSAYPTSKPKASVTYFTGIYGNSKDEGLNWWNRDPIDYENNVSIPLREALFKNVKNPMYSGISFSSSQQIGNLDLTMGGNYFVQEGYRQYDYEKRSRFNTNLRYRSKNISGLAVGLNTNFMSVQQSDFFLWRADTFAFEPNPMLGTTVPMYGFRMNIDPFAYYYTKSGIRHSIRTRMFNVINDFPTDSTKISTANTYYGEYQLHMPIRERYNITTGLVASHSDVSSNLYGDHFSNNFAAYGQFDADFGRLKFTFGLRGEYFKVDTAQTESMVDFTIGGDSVSIPIKPVFRTGLNYRLFDNTFVRASLGQGYRFPTIAEKYTATELGMVKIFPNPEVTAENSWSGEIGVKQGFRLPGNWQGYADAAFFIQDIYNMMEFTFDRFNPVTLKPHQPEDTVFPEFGFQAQNVGDVRILGSEITLMASGDIGNVKATVMTGYTYTYPTNRAGLDTTASSLSPILKYRYRHSFKADVGFEYKNFFCGFNMIYKSPIENVDRLFADERDPETVDFNFYEFNRYFSSQILPGYWDYRIENADKHYFILDTRIGYNISEHLRASFLVKNIFNTLYVGRPGDMHPPRRYELLLNVRF